MKNLKIFLLAMALCMTLVLALAACGPTQSESSTKESESESKSEQPKAKYTVTFYYADLSNVKTADLASMIDANGKLTNTSLYTMTYQKTCESGEGVPAPTSKQMEKAEVRGYARDWSNGDWRNDVTEDITVYATYKKLNDVKVTFTNSNGAPIKVLDTYATYKVEKEEYPDTYELVYYYSESYLATLQGYNPANYVEYAPKDVNGNDILMDKDSKVTADYSKAETQYILATDQEKLATSIALPFGWYFDAWSGKVTSLQIDGTVTAEVKMADGVIKKTNITVDGTKDDGYVEIGGLYPNIISNKRENGKTGDYQLYAKYKSIEEVPEKDRTAWLAEKDAWEAATKPVCSCHESGESHDPIDATLYLAWDGDFVYVYAEVKDAHVVSHGKSYCQNRANPYENDGVEIWYGIAGDFNKVCLDAFGYKLYGAGEGNSQTSAYINKCKSASKLMTSDGYLAESVFNAWNGAIVTQQMSKDAGITGYTVEFSFAAYEEPMLSDGEELKDDKSNWGKKLTTGQIFSLSIQLDDISETASDEIVNNAIASEDSVSIDNLYGAAGKKNPNDRINLGVQGKKADQDGVFTLILG